MSETRKIKLEEWLLFTHNYFDDLRGKDIFDETVREEVNRRIKQLDSLEKMLYKSGQLEEPPDDFDESYRQLCEAYKKLGWPFDKSKEAKERTRKFSHGEGGFAIYSGITDDEATEAIKKLAREKGLKIKKFERIR